MKFDDRESRKDRLFNKIYLDYRKFTSEDTCPTCNCADVLKIMRDTAFDKEKNEYVKIKWIHNDKRCFGWYVSIIFATKKDSKGKFLSEETINEMIERGYKLMRSFDRKFTERGK